MRATPKGERRHLAWCHVVGRGYGFRRSSRAAYPAPRVAPSWFDAEGDGDAFVRDCSEEDVDFAVDFGDWISIFVALTTRTCRTTQHTRQHE